MRKSFAFRLALTFAAVGILAAVITALLVNVAFGYRFAHYLQQQREGRQSGLIQSLAESYTRNRGWDPSDLQSLSALALEEGGEIRLFDAQGNIVWEPTATPEGEAMAQMHRQMLGGGPLGPEQSIGVTVGEKLVGTVAQRLPAPGLNPQDVAFRASVNWLLLLGGLIAGLLALVMGIVLARRTLTPARQMTEAAQALAAGDRTHRVPVDTTVELGAMGEAFNKMADTIEEEDRLRRLFATDVAHELRTPLAIQRSQLEALQDGISEPTPEVITSLHEENLRLTRLVEDLEALASAEAAPFSMKPVDVDLEPVLESVAAQFTGPFDLKGVELAIDLVPARGFADPQRVSQIVSNLLSNALKYTPEGGRVTLSLRPAGKFSELRVADTGGGISPEELPHVFDRFYRGAGVKAGGSGVGLTVVQELVEAHGGTVLVADNDEGGSTFTVRLPASETPISRPATDGAANPAETPAAEPSGG
jgi:two-component system sensor histidine kinase BaeS